VQQCLFLLLGTHALLAENQHRRSFFLGWLCPSLWPCFGGLLFQPTDTLSSLPVLGTSPGLVSALFHVLPQWGAQTGTWVCDPKWSEETQSQEYAGTMGKELSSHDAWRPWGKLHVSCASLASSTDRWRINHLMSSTLKAYTAHGLPGTF
jgi:hypothetical protein